MFRISALLFVVLSFIFPFYNPQPVDAVGGMSQVFFGGSGDALNNLNSEYNVVMSGGNWDATEWNKRQMVTTPGEIGDIYIELSATPGVDVGDAYTFALVKNGIVTSLSCTITQPALSAKDIFTTVSVVAGDMISLQCIPVNTPSDTPNARWSMIFTGTNASESNILSACLVNNAGTSYSCLMNGMPITYNATEAGANQVCPTDGQIKKLYVSLNVSPGVAPDAYRYTLRKNGISTALTCTITAPATTSNDIVNSVSVVSGDILTIMVEPLNVPANSPNSAFGTTFVASIDGESIILGGTQDDLNTAAIEYNQITPVSNQGSWIATETDKLELSQVCVIKKLYVRVSVASGVGTSWTFTLRSNISDAPLLVILNNVATGYDITNQVSIGIGDDLSIKCTPTGVPVVADAYWGMVCYSDKASLNIIDAKVFKSYKQNGDWLMVLDYVNMKLPHYPNDDVTSYFEIQFRTDTTTVIAANPCRQWGQKPGSIYLSRVQVNPLEWGNVNYRLVIIATYDNSIVYSYILQSVDWLGQDLDRLDSYCLDIAHNIESNAVVGSVDEYLTTDIATRGEVLNDTGSVYFNKGIPGLMQIRPNLFSTSSLTPEGEEGHGISYRPAWQEMLGTYVTGVFNDTGNVFGVDGKAIGFTLLLLSALGVMSAFGTGHTTVALFMTLPVLVTGLFLGLLDAAAFAILASVMIILMVRQLWFLI
jgi:hypothetical protein